MNNKISIESQEFRGGYKNKIIEAINSKNVEQLVSALQDTNMALTGLEQAHFSKGAGIKGLKEDLTKLFRDAEKYSHADVVVYLGDGGYSRLVINIEKNGEIMVNPSYNSLDEVKEKWEKIQ